MGNNFLTIFNGPTPNEVITVISYSLDNFEILIANDIKNDIGNVNNKICGTVI